jgi:hypothetical protein
MPGGRRENQMENKEPQTTKESKRGSGARKRRNKRKKSTRRDEKGKTTSFDQSKIELTEKTKKEEANWASLSS